MAVFLTKEPTCQKYGLQSSEETDNEDDGHNPLGHKLPTLLTAIVDHIT